MVLIVHKYGGTSVGSIEHVKNVAKHVAKWHRTDHQIVVVPSAMSDGTNRLLGIAKEVSAQPDPHELDMIASTGEQVSAGLLAITLHAEGIDARSYTGWQVLVKTDSAYTKMCIQPINNGRVRAGLDAGRVVVITGFQGIDSKGRITTLGRGGSDTSAVAVAAVLETEEYPIYTDIDGIYTTGPCVVGDARRLDKVTFGEMLKMANLGSKVLQIHLVEFAGKYRVEARVLSSLTDPLMPLDVEVNSGALITFEEDSNMEAVVISGIAFIRGEAGITVIGVPDKPGITYQILGPVADVNIDVNMIIQNQLVEERTDFTLIVPRGEYQRTLAILNDNMKAHIGTASVSNDPKASRVSVVGVGIHSHIGVASRMFRMLSEEGISIQMISTLEIKISMLTDKKYMKLAMRALHKAFELNQT